LGFTAREVKEIAMATPVVLITAALSGIGRAAAFAFEGAGSRLIVSDRRPDAGEALAGELRSLGGEAEFIQAYVTSELEIRHNVDRTVERFGRLDAAVSSAGAEGKPGPVTEQTRESFAATFDTSVLGTSLSMKHELRVMQAQGAGSIVNISSTMDERGAANMSIYIKHAVEGLAKSAAIEAAAFGVRVNAVATGPTETAMLERLTGSPDRKAIFFAAVPMKRAATPKEIADAILFVASDKASYTTGQILRVNGGKTAKSESKQRTTARVDLRPIPNDDSPPRGAVLDRPFGGTTDATTPSCVTLTSRAS
jgi:NAD(P)-dependent dehydrogenase (short-subunit alcohol dehydrogenase family)